MIRLVPWNKNCYIGTLKQILLAVASFWSIPICLKCSNIFMRFFPYVEDVWPLCSHQVFAAGSILGPCATSTHGLFQDLTCSGRMKLFALQMLSAYRQDSFLSQWFSTYGVIIGIYIYIFAAWAQDIWMYCNQSTLQHWWPGDYSRSIPELLYLMATDTSAHSRSWAMKEFQVWLMGME